MKKFFRLLLGLLAGVGAGVLIGTVIGMIADGVSVGEAFGRLNDIDFGEMALVCVSSLVFAAVALLLQIILHEAGHLIMGLLTGYRFVSFRIFNLTLLRQDGRLRIKRFALAGTGGQCLMSPPDRPIAEIDTRWYNLGGVLMNALTAAAALLCVCLFPMNVWLKMFLAIFSFFGICCALLNGIPMKVSGIGNDGYNLLHLEREPENKRFLYCILAVNARLQSGERIDSLPEEWFYSDGTPDWSNGLEANWRLMGATRLLAQHRWQEAYDELSAALCSEDRIMKIMLMELKCELTYACLMLGKTAEAQTHFDSELQTYAAKYSSTQSGKKRLLAAWKLVAEGDRAGAEAELDYLRTHRDDYLIRGEADMDISLTEHLLLRSETAVEE